MLWATEGKGSVVPGGRQEENAREFSVRDVLNRAVKVFECLVVHLVDFLRQQNVFLCQENFFVYLESTNNNPEIESAPDRRLQRLLTEFYFKWGKCCWELESLCYNASLL